jgi:hypothetical protein
MANMKTQPAVTLVLGVVVSGLAAASAAERAGPEHPGRLERLEPPGVVKSLNGLTGRVTLAGGSNVTVRRVGNGFRIDAKSSAGGDGGQDWSRAGNAAAPGEFLGTLNDTPLELKVNGQRALRVEAGAAGPNIVAGFSGNHAVGATGATIAGGGTGADLFFGFAKPNEIGSAYGTIGGGLGNWIAGFSGFGSTIAGGDSNRIAGHVAVISGGQGNRIDLNAEGAVVAGGLYNQIEPYAAHSTIGGGWFNAVLPFSHVSTIGGGMGNTIHSNAWGVVVAGGVANNVGEAAVWSAIGGGQANVITANAQGATIPGGYGNFVSGSYSLAAGQRAIAAHRGSFVWSDSAGDGIGTSTSNQFVVRASGGVQFYSSPSGTLSGVELAPGAGAWATLSDRYVKENCRRVDPREVLDRVAKLPIQTWNMKTQAPSIRHIGPMAQDFHAAFGVGEDDRHISTVDADGVALAAIQGLVEVVKEKDARISTLERRVAELEKAMRHSLRRDSDDHGLR